MKNSKDKVLLLNNLEVHILLMALWEWNPPPCTLGGKGLEHEKNELIGALDTLRRIDDYNF